MEQILTIYLQRVFQIQTKYCKSRDPPRGETGGNDSCFFRNLFCCFRIEKKKRYGGVMVTIFGYLMYNLVKRLVLWFSYKLLTVFYDSNQRSYKILHVLIHRILTPSPRICKCQTIFTHFPYD